MTITARRIHDRPIIDQTMSPVIGDNINGPTLIRVPDWVRRPLGRYYLYFAHHEGRSIRLAHADRVTGPWTIHAPGALGIEQSLFPAHVDPDAATTESRDPHARWGFRGDVAHIASPDVLIDDGNRRFLMYFHGLVGNGDQMTRLATSDDGIGFTAQPPLFDHYYFRTFLHRGVYWVISWGGYLFRAEAPTGPFERGPNLFETAPISPPGRPLRHLGLMRDGERLHVFFTRIGDAPEAILHTSVALHPDWQQWRVAEPVEILRPAEAWEGADLAISPSRPGAAHAPEHALRDPCVFRDDDGTVYLLYSGAGEQAIGLVELTGI